MRHPTSSTEKGLPVQGGDWDSRQRKGKLFLHSEAECTPRCPPAPSSEAQSRATLVPHFDLRDRVGKALWLLPPSMRRQMPL